MSTQKVFIGYYPKLSQQQRFEGKKILTQGKSLTSRILAWNSADHKMVIALSINS